MPNILPLEWTVVAAAFVVFCTLPVLLAWLDALRMRRAAAAIAAREASVDAPAELPGSGVSSSALTEALPEIRADAVSAEEVPSAQGLSRSPREYPAAVPDEPVAATQYAFCLQELRRVRLSDWPPAGVRQDAEQRQRWEEGQRLLDTGQGRIDTLRLRASFPPQAYCYAGAEIDDDRVRVRFLLFPGLWPSAATEATAAAVVTMGRGEVSGTVEAVDPQR